MFHQIPDEVLARMRELKQKESKDTADDTARFERLRQIPPETGHLLALIAASAPSGAFIEIGTSGGYSGLWISLACRALGRGLTTFEIAEAKVALATETFRKAGVDDIVSIVPGDVREQLAGQSDVAFCFLDVEKDLYQECYDAVLPNMLSGVLLVADNIISHAGDLAEFLDRAESDERVDSMIVPVGNGVLLVRRV